MPRLVGASPAPSAAPAARVTVSQSSASEMSGEMVYYNPLMYRGQGVQGQSYPGWYPPGYHHQAPQQQFLSCMHDAAEQQWHHHYDWPAEPEPVLASPGVTGQSTSGGSELSSPGLPPRPPPARSPYEWMRKPSYQSQPNPGESRLRYTIPFHQLHPLYNEHVFIVCQLTCCVAPSVTTMMV